MEGTVHSYFRSSERRLAIYTKRIKTFSLQRQQYSDLVELTITDYILLVFVILRNSIQWIQFGWKTPGSLTRVLWKKKKRREITFSKAFSREVTAKNANINYGLVLKSIWWKYTYSHLSTDKKIKIKIMYTALAWLLVTSFTPALVHQVAVVWILRWKFKGQVQQHIIPKHRFEGIKYL